MEPNPKSNPRGLRKALVWTVVTVALAQAGMNVASIAYWMVRQDRDAASLIHPTALDAIQTISIVINAPLVQGFLTMRAARVRPRASPGPPRSS